MRYTPEYISELKENECFVFGSNLKGQHGGGAAKQAVQWGAKWGVGIGHRGQTYAIPTKYDFQKTLTIDEIRPFVNQFINYAFDNLDITFLVTKIGCGLAGHSEKDMALLFNQSLPSNIIIPIEFSKILQNAE